jgi:hypothetical protein
MTDTFRERAAQWHDRRAQTHPAGSAWRKWHEAEAAGLRQRDKQIQSRLTPGMVEEFNRIKAELREAHADMMAGVRGASERYQYWFEERNRWVR